jgi:sugar/nucleoside kinase (ribokinase family)
LIFHWEQVFFISFCFDHFPKKMKFKRNSVFFTIMNVERKDLVLAGHLCLDTIIVKSPFSEVHCLGGGVTYGSLSAAHYDSNAKIGVVSQIGKSFDKQLLSIFDGYNIDLSGIHQDGEKTTHYQLTYYDEGRDLKLLSKANNLQIQDFPQSFLSAPAIHMTPIANEFTPEFIQSLAEHDLTQDAVVGIDVQGVIRDFDQEGNIILNSNQEKQNQIRKMLQTFGSRMIFKGSDGENCAVAGVSDPIEATLKLGESGAHIFTTFGRHGLVYKHPDHQILRLFAYEPRCMVDETGAGDCFMATLLLQLGRLAPKDRTYDAIVAASRNSSSASSFLVEAKGPQGFGCCAEIESRVKSGKQIISSKFPIHP